jgi:hypothetical protein
MSRFLHFHSPIYYIGNTTMVVDGGGGGRYLHDGAVRINHYFFLPGLGLLLLIRREWRFLLTLILGFVLMYIVETVYFVSISEGPFPILGRLYYMLTRSSYISIQHPDDTIGLSFSNLIIDRWWDLNLPARISYYGFFLASFLYMGRQRFKKPFLGKQPPDSRVWHEMMLVFVSMGLSFALISTFFVGL